MSVEVSPKSAPSIDNLLPISLATLRPADCLAIDLYLKAGSDGTHTLYRERSFPLTAEDLRRLIAQGVRALYISPGQRHWYQDYLRDSTQALLHDERLAPVRRYLFLSEMAQELVRQSFESGKPDKAADDFAELAVHMATLVAHQDLMAQELFVVLRHDYFTFTHSFNVATLCLLLAKALGFRDDAELQEIARGALLHDLGKLKVPNAILTKPGPLTEQEREVIEAHPRTGFMQLCHRQDLTRGQLMMIYQHHERLNGSGYPVRIGDTEIHHLAQLCAVIDVFEAMTSARPYRKAIPVAGVLNYLDEQAGTGLNKEMVRCWRTTMSKA